MSVEVLLTVGKVDASLAILTTKDHYVIEFPTILLPDNVKAGSVVKMMVEQDLEEEAREKEEFNRIQEEILEKYGKDAPRAPVLHLLNATQTSCVLGWDPVHIGSSQLKSLILYKQGSRQQLINDISRENEIRLSGLSVDSEYEFQLLLNTTSGELWSNKLIVHTHKMTDMSGITICTGQLGGVGSVTRAQIEASLAKMGARPLQEHVNLETTHFVLDTVGEDDVELEKAKTNNIPIVRPEWIRACELEKRIVGVRDFYVEVDPLTLSAYKFPAEGCEVDEANSEEAAAEANGEEAAAEEPTAQEPTAQEPTAEEPTAEANAEANGEEPTAQEPTAQEPTAEEPTAEEPTTEANAEEPTAEEPTTEANAEANGEEPTAQEPTAQEPTAEEPTAEEPTTEANAEEPTAHEPTTEANSEEPTAHEPTTEANGEEAQVNESKADQTQVENNNNPQPSNSKRKNKKKKSKK